MSVNEAAVVPAQPTALVALAPEIVAEVNKWSNSFRRPTVPTDLLTQSEVTGVIEEGAKLLSVTFMYGERHGRLREVPYDDSEVERITDLSVESLWLYDSDLTLDAPEDFREARQVPFQISTGRTRKCPSCRGSGRVRCSSCGGKVQWMERSGDDLIQKTCSCGDGKETCGMCAGYCYVLTVIECQTTYKLSYVTNQEYEGDVPKQLLAQTTGRILLEEMGNYPQDKMKVMLQGGIDAAEYLQLQDLMRLYLHEVVAQQLAHYEGNTQLVYSLIDQSFAQIPNPAVQNKLLEYEILPVRLRLKVEDAPVMQLNYSYKAKPYQLWVYGNERKIYAPQTPFAFTARLGGILGAITAILVMFLALIVTSAK